MAETIITIDIAAQLKSGIQSALTTAGLSTVAVRADGVRDTTTETDAVVLPCVAIEVAEGMCHSGGAQASKLRDYQVSIQVLTHCSDDPWRTNLLTISQAVDAYILGPPSVALSAATFLAINLPTQPTRLGDQERVQGMQFDPVVKVKVT
jgi:hypothetical protein